MHSDRDDFNNENVGVTDILENWLEGSYEVTFELDEDDDSPAEEPSLTDDALDRVADAVREGLEADAAELNGTGPAEVVFGDAPGDVEVVQRDTSEDPDVIVTRDGVSTHLSDGSPYNAQLEFDTAAGPLAYNVLATQATEQPTAEGNPFQN